jgi:hypothetical protein
VWHQKVTDQLEACDCLWPLLAGKDDLEVHYRVKGLGRSGMSDIERMQQDLRDLAMQIADLYELLAIHGVTDREEEDEAEGPDLAEEGRAAPG